MRKMVTALFMVIILLFGACASNAGPILQGAYQSDKQKIGYAVVLSFQQDNSSFIEYIDNREVDRGTYEKIRDNVYQIKSNQQNFEIILNAENSFEIVMKKLNDGKSIQLKNISDTPVEFLTKFDDTDKYKALLD